MDGSNDVNFSPDKLEDSDETECGIGKCHSKKLRPCVNVKLFTVILAIILTFNGSAGTYLVSVITTLEKAFQITSSKSGFITTANDIGFTCAILLITHYTSKFHKPRVLAVCGFTIGVASIMCALPYFIYGNPEISISTKDEQQQFPSQIDYNDIIKLSKNYSYVQTAVTDLSLCDTERVLSEGAMCDKEEAERSSDRSTGSYAIVIFGQIIIGVAMSPVWSLGLAYIDDNVPKYSSPIYIGILFSLRTLAPIMGFGLGAGIISIPIDLKSSNLPQNDPRRIGAWWLGFVIFGLAGILTSIPMAFFPRRMPPVLEPAPDDEGDELKTKHRRRRSRSKSIDKGVKTVEMLTSTNNEQNKITLMDFPRALVRIFKHQVYMWLIISCSLNVFYGQGFYSFMPKYMEKQFHVQPSTANLILGICSGVAAGAGTILGGWLVSHRQWSRLQVAKYWFIFELIGTLILYTLIFPYCHQSPVKDVTTENSNLSCSIDCNCSPTLYRPVCGSDITYTTPCQAGCPFTVVDQNYSNCSCVADRVATTGECSISCYMHIVFGIILFVKTFFMSLCAVPFVTLLMRTVSSGDKALAVGVLLFVANICGIPSPVLYGAIIDGVCLYRDRCIEEICYIYDNQTLRYKYFGLAFGLKTLCQMAVFPAWFILRRHNEQNEQENEQRKKLNLDEINATESEQK